MEKQLCVDDIVEAYDLSTVEILHSDIQGAEHQMLMGSTKSIEEKKIKYFFVSTHSDGVHRHCLDFLKNKQFYILCSHTQRESFSQDGLIVASLEDSEKIIISKR